MKISIPKQVAVLQRNIVKVFNYQVNTLTLNDDGSIYVVIEPSDGYWKGGRYPFSISFPDDFPENPPSVTNLDEEIAHPNISTDGGVCLNILGYEWDSSYGIADIIQGLLFLFYEPAFDDALTDAFYYNDDYPTLNFDEYVRERIRVSIESQRNKRLALLDEENGYIVSLASSIVSEVVRSQVEYKEVEISINPLKRRHSKNFESEPENVEISLRRYISI
jgi:ubiquitin-conjugating enzyme E2 M